MDLRKLTVNDYTKELASKKSVPGGGSAAALVAEMGASLLLMVGRITKPKLKKKDADKLADAIHDLNQLKKSIGKVVNKDAVAYEKVTAAYSLPKSDKNRANKIEKALMLSYESMRDLAADICLIKKLHAEVSKVAGGAIANDLKVSMDFIKASFSSAISTAKINIDYIKDKAISKQMKSELANLKKLFTKSN